MAEPAASQAFFDLWRKQLEEGAQAWVRLLAAGAPAAPADPAKLWAPFVEPWVQAWARAFAQTPMTPDLLAQWKRFLDESLEAWSRALGQAMQTEAFAQALGRYLDQWLAACGPLKKAGEQTTEAALEVLGLASRSQLTRVAAQIVELDRRLERVEDGVATALRKLDDLARAEGRRPATGREAATG